MKKSDLFVRLRHGLVEPKHVAKIGNSIWLYIFILKSLDWRTGVLENYTDSDMSEKMGIPTRTVRKYRENLTKEEYIKTKRLQYGLRITVIKYNGAQIDTPVSKQIDTQIDTVELGQIDTQIDTVELGQIDTQIDMPPEETSILLSNIDSDKIDTDTKKEENKMSEPKKLGDLLDGMIAYAKAPMGEYADFPEDTQTTIKAFCELWKIKPPRKGGGEYKRWIDDSRDLREACGEIGFPVLEKLYKEWMAKGCQFLVSSPGSLVKSARGIAGTMRESKPKVSAPQVDPKKARGCEYCNGVGLVKEDGKYLACPKCQEEK